jgi:glyoxylase-like metal-dependent hydrolase (beta-lactamase superfamily II)
MQINPFFDSRTWTLTYLVWDEESRDAILIDPVLDYDPLRVRVYEESLGKILEAVDIHELKLRWTLETHVHADHFSAAARLRELRGVPVAISSRITEVQSCFRPLFGLPEDFPVDGRQFDRLFEDDSELEAGTLRVRALQTPGHTPACMAYQIGDALFTGDALFIPDFGTGRCDFPGGSAEALYHSIQRLYRLPDTTRVFPGHDYQPGGRPLRWESSIAENKASNVHLRADTSREQYVAFRTGRDATLTPPALIFPALQVNIRAGALPEPDADGRRQLRMPLGVF